MNKKILLLFAFVIANLSINGQQCQNLDISSTEANCAIPTTTLQANFLNLNYQTTDSYVVNGDAPCPPVVSDPTSAQIALDDQWAPIIFNIGFNFCFYGNTYDQVIVSGNGVVSFDLSVVEDYLITNPNGTGPFHVWNTNANLDLPSPQLQPNAIFGPYTDPNPATAPNPFDTIKFDLVNQDNPGNRVFVVEYDAPMYSCGNEYLHSRIKLYETSNVVDIEILEKGRCDQWENSTGIVGIQNKSATLATIVPGRQNADGGWWVNGDPTHGGQEANQELWRFVPDGNPLSYDFQWFANYGDGNGYQELFPLINDPTTLVVDPENPQVPGHPIDYEARLTYQTECSIDSTVLSEVVTIDAPDIENIQEPIGLTACEDSFGSDTADFDINQDTLLLSEYVGSQWNLTDFTITYYLTETDRDNETNPITQTNPFNATDGTIIYVRIVYDDGSINCFDVNKEFTLNVTPLDDATFSYSQSIYCTTDSNPTPTATTPLGSFAINNGGIINTSTGEIDLVASGFGDDGTGAFTVTYTTPGPDCPNSSDITINIDTNENANFTYPSTVCLADSNPSPLSFNTGGIFTINNGGVINANTGEIDLTNTLAGIYIIEYAFNGGNCPSSDTQTITIYSEDDATFSYPNTAYCNDDINPSPSTVTSSGTFTIDNGGIIDVNTGIVDLAASGNGDDENGDFVITYTTNGNCPNSQDFQLSIVLREDASFDFPTDVCAYDTNPQAFDIVTSGGIFSVNNGASIDSNGVLDLSTTTPGDYEITYGFLTGLCTSSTTKTITVHEIPNANMPSTLLTECNNGDGTANFDLNALEDDILLGQTDVTLTFHPTYQDAQDNTNVIITIPFARVDGDVFARVENLNGCFSIVEIYLTIDDCYVVLPEGFSPSSNIEENQTFNMDSLKEIYPKFKLFIFNRYGNQVYEGDASSENWNGKLNNDGKLLPVGTYFYGIKLNDEQELTNRGWVYLQQ